MLDRARWTGKMAEAEIYRRWVVGKLSTPFVESPTPFVLSVIDNKTKPALEEESAGELKRAA
jgi:hypothetical protein